MSEIAFRPIQPADYAAFALSLPAENAIGWVAEIARPVAVILFYPLPGLPHIADFFLFTQPRYRQRGVGTALLEHALHALRQTPITTVTARFEHERVYGARFLLARGFGVEHVEWEMRLRKPERVPAAGVMLYSLPLDDALPLFRRLYDAAFRPNLWYQPWESDDEIRADWSPGDELLFLDDAHEEPIGFVWLRYTGRRRVELEPIGIVATHQGHGFGRKLLLATLNHLARQRVRTVNLGVWESNRAAVTLYESVGFYKTSSRVFLSRAVPAEPT